MRSLIITVILFAAMCTAIVFNNLYIKNAAKFIEACVSDEEFERDPEAAIEKLDDFWQKNHSIVGLSVGYKELDRLSDLIIDLRVYTELHNPDDHYFRNLLLYGVEFTNYLTDANGNVVSYTEGDNVYNMNPIYTGNLFYALYSEQKGWNKTVKNNGKSQNDESVAAITDRFKD